jgi:hypothetical protein
MSFKSLADTVNQICKLYLTNERDTLDMYIWNETAWYVDFTLSIVDDGRECDFESLLYGIKDITIRHYHEQYPCNGHFRVFQVDLSHWCTMKDVDFSLFNEAVHKVYPNGPHCSCIRFTQK